MTTAGTDRSRSSRLGIAIVGGALWLLAFAGLAMLRAARLAAEDPTAVADLGPRVEAGWLAATGQLSGWTMRAHVGPLAAAIGAPAAWLVDDAPTMAAILVIAGGSLAYLWAWRAVREVRGERARVGALVVLLPFALHFEGDAPAAMALLAAAVAVGRAVRGGTPAAREILAAAGALIFAILWTPLAIAPALAAALGAGLAGAVVRARGGLSTAGGALALVMASLGAWTAAAWLGGAAPGALWDGGWLAPHERGGLASLGLWAHGAIGVGAVTVLARRHRSPASAVSVGAALGPWLLGASGWTMHRPQALIWPLAAVMGLEALALRRDAPRAAWALLGWAALFAVAWLPPQPGALDPAQLRAMSDEHGPAALTDDEEAAVRWAREARVRGCVVWRPELPLARFEARVRGPVDLLRLHRSGRRLAREIRSSDCRYALMRVGGAPSPTDPGASGFGADDVALAERYRPVRMLTPTLVLAERRRAPRPGAASVDLREISRRRSPIAEGRAAGACHEEAKLLGRPARDWIVSNDRLVWIEGDGLRLRPRAGEGGAARAHVRAAPCAGACLFAEVGVVGDHGEVSMTLDVGGPAGRRVLLERGLSPGWRRPVQIPLRAGEGPWIGWTVSSPDGDATALVHRPRLGPCTALHDLVHQLHHGAVERVPADADVEIIGDELRLGLGSTRSPPPRVELALPARYRDGAAPCLGVDLSVTRARETGVMVGVRRGTDLRWLQRLVLTADRGMISVRGQSLESFVGASDARLVFSAWPIGPDDPPGVAVFARPTIYRCDSWLLWPF